MLDGCDSFEPCSRTRRFFTESGFWSASRYSKLCSFAEQAEGLVLTEEERMAVESGGLPATGAAGGAAFVRKSSGLTKP